MAFIDLTGQKFSRLTAIERHLPNSQNGNCMWLCQCDCGKKVVVDGYSLRKGITRSCGCLRKDIAHDIAMGNQSFRKSMGNMENLKTKDGVFWASLHKSSRNNSSVIGVSYDKGGQVWIARLRFNGKYVLNRSSKSFSEAVDMRRKAELQYWGETKLPRVMSECSRNAAVEIEEEQRISV